MGVLEHRGNQHNWLHGVSRYVVKFTSSSACFGLYDIVEQAKVMHKIDVRSAVEMQLFVSNPFSSSVVTKNISLLQS